MEKNNEKIEVLRDYPVPKAVMSLAIPTMMMMVVQVFYNLTDTFFVGMLNDSNAIAAMNVAFPVFMILQIAGQVFGNGGASYISRLLGEGKDEKANGVASIAVWSTLVVGIIMAILCVVFMDDLLALCGVSENTFAMTKSYLSIVVYGSAFVGLQMTLSSCLRSEGATKQAMIGMMLGTFLNIILDPIFILGFGMGVSGAALATVIGYIVGFIYFAYQYSTNKTAIKVGISHFKFKGSIYKEIFKIGVPSSVTMLLMTFSNLIINNVAVGYNKVTLGLGDNLIASYGTANKVTMGIIMIVMGLAMGCQPLIGYSYGAKKGKKIKEIIKFTGLIGTTICLVGAIVLNVFSTEIMSVFIKDADTLALGSRVIDAVTFSLPFVGIQMLLMVVFQSVGRGKEGMIIALGRQGIFFIPALYILNTLFGIDGFIWAQTVASILTTFIAFVFYVRLNKELDVH